MPLEAKFIGAPHQRLLMRKLQTTMRTLILACIVLLLAGRASAQQVSYKKQIAPIFAASCNACHGAKMPQSGLTTTSYAALMKGGTRGKSVIPGKPEESLLVQYIDGRKQPRMPIGGALKPEEIARIKKWIAEGAKTDGEASPVAPAGPAIKVRPDILPQVAALAWSKDGKLLAAGTYKEVLLFEQPGGKLLRKLTGHSDVVRGLAFSPDGAVLAAAGGVPGQGGELTLWNTTAWAAVKRLQGHADCIYGLAWRPDGKQITTTSYDKTVRIWDVEKGQPVTDLKDHADAVYGAGYSPNGKFMATGSADRSIRVWDPNTAKRLYTLAGHTEMVTALAFHPTQDQLATASADKSIRLWNLKPDGGDAARTLGGQPDVLTDVRYSPDGKLLATAGNDGSVKLWNPADGANVRTLPNAGDAVLALAFSPNSEQLAVGGYDGSVKIYKVADASLVATLLSPPVKAAQGK
jgi:WD40 repeat protein